MSSVVEWDIDQIINVCLSEKKCVPFETEIIISLKASSLHKNNLNLILIVRYVFG